MAAKHGEVQLLQIASCEVSSAHEAVTESPIHEGFLCFPIWKSIKVVQSCAALPVARLLGSKRNTTSAAGVNWLEAIAPSRFNRVNQLSLTITPNIMCENELPQ